jgi:hypothetical protein
MNWTGKLAANAATWLGSGCGHTAGLGVDLCGAVMSAHTSFAKNQVGFAEHVLLCRKIVHNAGTYGRSGSYLAHTM